MPDNSSSIYPVALNLQGRRCLVVGGGQIACRKAEGLLQAGANVTVVAPEVTRPLRQRENECCLTIVERAFQPNDVSGMTLIFAATNSPTVNDAVTAAAKERNILCSRVDGISGSDFANMGVVQRGELVIAISTGGDSPAFTRWVRQQVETYFGPEYGDFLQLLSMLRKEVLAQVPAEERPDRWARALASEAFPLFCAGDEDGAIRRLRAELGLVQST
ncbi:MAG: bifunctional precorrin-2 dehydrogenase/sirohydrochlorin ferrochelatase [Armatimonadota bacterium]|nr:bifunctional precorrin-2 dehydrogenase/sirohydrochlorin ferrochelatase [Armatimonadota bacterium]